MSNEIEKYKGPLPYAKELANRLKEAAKYNTEEDRQDLISRLKEELVTKVVESTSLAETLKGKVINSLIAKIEEGDISTSQLLRIYKQISESSIPNLAISTGNQLPGTGKSGFNVNINNLQNTPGQQGTSGGMKITHEKNPIMGAGQLLEAVDIISREISKKGDLVINAKEIQDGDIVNEIPHEKMIKLKELNNKIINNLRNKSDEELNRYPIKEGCGVMFSRINYENQDVDIVEGKVTSQSYDKDLDQFLFHVESKNGEVKVSGKDLYANLIDHKPGNNSAIQFFNETKKKVNKV